MRVVHTIPELREQLAGRDRRAFVPTMGNLHEGHLGLVRQARALVGPEGFTVASIFVNRLQFLPHEDFEAYPRTWQADQTALRDAGCDLLFAPTEEALYPQPQRFTVRPDPALASCLEGEFRPGFFDGVATVVLKLFACVFAGARAPGLALFGKKDYQQWLVVRQLVHQFALDVRVEGGETRRAADGLALSSRNGYLRPEERAEAPRLHRTLQWLAHQVAIARPDADCGRLEAEAMQALSAHGWRPDYLSIRRQCDLSRPASLEEALVILAAARLGTTRLIDNLELASRRP